MSYSPNKLLELISMRKFMELEAFVSIMDSIYEVDLNNAVMRRQAQVRITQLYKQVPVIGPTLRFPDKFHVDLSVGQVSIAIRKLIKVMVSFEMDKSFEQFYDLLNQIRDLTYELDYEKLIQAGIYTRATFEEKYGFAWN